jgi:hypothetical protein
MRFSPESPFSAQVPGNCIAPEANCKTKAAFVSKKPTAVVERPGDLLPFLPRLLIAHTIENASHSICTVLLLEQAQSKRGIVPFLVTFIHASRPQRSPATHPALESSD